MSYVDAFHDTTKDKILVSERVNGERKIITLHPEYNFYFADPRGKVKSVYGEPVTEVRCKTLKEFRKNIAINRATGKLYETDVKPVNKTLEKHYLNIDPPKLHSCFFDIEVDFDPVRGFSSPEDAFMPITAIGVYLDWMDAMVCLAVPPKTLSWEQAQNIGSQYKEVILFKDEAEMLKTFLTLIEDADILSGWNSEGYDIPYTVNRIVKILGRSETRRLCLFNQLPKERKFESFGSERQSYDLIGRVHLDYLQLYRKYNYEERHSYRLDAIGEIELGEKKVVYDGSLDRLYNHDFGRFLEYNIQDVMLIANMDKKLQFIDLANTIAHDNTVLLYTTMGAVATTEQAIINEAHRRGFVVPDRKRGGSKKDTAAAGAYVAFPQKGFHEWIGSMDINSLYPSVFRALNMAPETIVGQLRPDFTDEEILNSQKLDKKSFADAWLGKFGTNEYEMVMAKDVNKSMTLDMEDGSTVEVTGADVYNLIFESGQPWCLSSNGTIFKTDVQGVVPGLLERWYAERQELQAKKKSAETDEENAFYDKRQLVKKINLNSLYGAILNPGCRFFDKRIGQSTTLTGRRITRHMGAKVNELLTGSYDHTGETIIYGDTDSIFLIDNKSVNDFIKQINKNLPDPMELEDEGTYESGIFLEKRNSKSGAKKRYALMNKDGSLTIKGLESKRGDWSKLSKDSQIKILTSVLKTKSIKSAEKMIREIIENINNNSMTIDNFILRNKLTRNLEDYKSIGPQVAAGRLMEKENLKVGPGTIVEYIVSNKKSKLIRDKVILAKNAKIEDIDKSYYIEKQLIAATYKIFELFNYKEEQLKNLSSGLSAWM